MNTTDLSGRTPLMHAASTAFVKCISLLLVFNAKINLRDSNGQNAIEVNIVELDGEILQGTELKKYMPRGRVFPIEIPDYL